MQKFHHKNLIVKAFTKRIKIFAVLVFAILLSATTVANVFNVTITTDGLAPNQLRGAIMAADALGGTHTINVAAGTYTLILGQIVLEIVHRTLRLSGPARQVPLSAWDRVFYRTGSFLLILPVLQTVQ